MRRGPACSRFSSFDPITPLMVGRTNLLAPLLLILLFPACAELELLTEGSGGGPGPPPSGSLSISFIDVGQGDGVLVQAGGQSYLIDAGRPEEGPNVVDFLRSSGVESLDGIVVTNPRI
jgi:competence protein ComEC